MPITAGGQDLSDLIITTSPGKTISGQVIFEGAPAGQKPRIYDEMQGTVDEKGRSS